VKKNHSPINELEMPQKMHIYLRSDPAAVVRQPTTVTITALAKIPNAYSLVLDRFISGVNSGPECTAFELVRPRDFETKKLEMNKRIAIPAKPVPRQPPTE
jgi:hypothetical protein